MKPIYCSKGHDNQPEHRFCQHCGEPLQQNIAGSFYPGMILGDRYRVLRELGHGGFGRTYLAEDSYRFDEPCVLKEFAPKAQGTYALQKAEELFEREAGVLYQLQHPQIPQFRELCRSQVENASRLFLVQDYVDGQTYRALLSQRRREGKLFGEAEVTELLLQILPVLDYIHSQGVIHRDISPDNLMLRNSDGLPVLIDFGGVKQIAADVESRVMAPPVGSYSVPVATRLGKVGYAPDEQMTLGMVYPHSDLYALAVTALVLLTGQEPQQIFDPQTLTWSWCRDGNVSPRFEEIVSKMLARRESDRYHSAGEVLQALTQSAPTPALRPDLAPAPVSPAPPLVPISATVLPTELPPEMNQPGVGVSSAIAPGSTHPPIAAGNGAISAGGAIAAVPQLSWERWQKVLPILLLVLSAGGVGWWGGNVWVERRSDRLGLGNKAPLFESRQPDLTDLSSRYSPEELQRKEELRDRRTKLDIDYQFYVNLVNEAFYDKYPAQRGRVLSYEPVDKKWRERWDEVAYDMLDRLSTLSRESRPLLGSYGSPEREGWKEAVNQLKLSSRALYDLADAKFFHLFPEQKGLDFINQPFGQVWHAIVADELHGLLTRQNLETISFSQGAFRQQVAGTLEPGAGKAFVAYLTKGQILRLSLQATESTLLSIYTPSGNSGSLVEDSAQQTWSGELPESGHYEIVVVSQTTQVLSFQLNLAADNVTSR